MRYRLIKYKIDIIRKYLLRNCLRKTLTNKQKGDLGQKATDKALESLGILYSKIPTSIEGQGDIDAVLNTDTDTLVLEIKNTCEKFYISYEWFDTHILQRFFDLEKVKLFMDHAPKIGVVIPKFTIRPSDKAKILNAVKQYHINFIETEIQALEEKDFTIWNNAISNGVMEILANPSTSSVLTTSSSNKINTILKIKSIILNARSIFTRKKASTNQLINLKSTKTKLKSNDSLNLSSTILKINMVQKLNNVYYFVLSKLSCTSLFDGWMRFLILPSIHHLLFTACAYKRPFDRWMGCLSLQSPPSHSFFYMV